MKQSDFSYYVNINDIIEYKQLSNCPKCCMCGIRLIKCKDCGKEFCQHCYNKHIKDKKC